MISIGHQMVSLIVGRVGDWSPYHPLKIKHRKIFYVLSNSTMVDLKRINNHICEYFTMLYDTILDHYPFLSHIMYGKVEYIGIIINQDQNVTSFYDYNRIIPGPDQGKFLELGETWWWESNRKIPISIFLKTDMQDFIPIIKTFVSKDVQLIRGPTVNLLSLTEKRIKRKSIQIGKRTR